MTSEDLSATAHEDNKGIIDGLWRREMKGSGPKGEGSRSVDVDLEEVHRTDQEGRLPDVEHAKAQRSKKEKQDMTLVEQSATEGNAKGGCASVPPP